MQRATVIMAGRKQMSEVLDDEAVILDTESGEYFGLDEVGAVVWQLIQSPATVAELHSALLQRFEVESERCERDLVALLEELQAEGLIEASLPDGESGAI